MHLGEGIKLLRKAKLWTQEQLQEISGVSERTIRRLEATGKAECATLVSILDALGTTFEELQTLIKDRETGDQSDENNFVPMDFLLRIENGKQLGKIIFNAHQLGFDYHDCKTDEQVEMVHGFLTSVADIMDLMSMITELSERFELENTLTDMVRELGNNGFWVFALRQEDKQEQWITAIVEVYSKDNPMIQKVKLDKNVVPKERLS